MNENENKQNETEQKPKVDPLKELKGSPQDIPYDKWGEYIRDRARRDPRYRRGGSRWKERGE
jgi:hypothetical protein